MALTFQMASLKVSESRQAARISFVEQGLHEAATVLASVVRTTSQVVAGAETAATTHAADVSAASAKSANTDASIKELSSNTALGLRTLSPMQRFQAKLSGSARRRQALQIKRIRGMAVSYPIVQREVDGLKQTALTRDVVVAESRAIAQAAYTEPHNLLR